MPLDFCEAGRREGVSGSRGRGPALTGAGHLELGGVTGNQVRGSSGSLGPTCLLAASMAFVNTSPLWFLKRREVFFPLILWILPVRGSTAALRHPIALGSFSPALAPATAPPPIQAIGTTSPDPGSGLCAQAGSHRRGESSGETEAWERNTQGPTQILTPVTPPTAGTLPTRSSRRQGDVAQLVWRPGALPAIVAQESPSAGHCSRVGEG